MKLAKSMTAACLAASLASALLNMRYSPATYGFGQSAPVMSGMGQTLSLSPNRSEYAPRVQSPLMIDAATPVGGGVADGARLAAGAGAPGAPFLNMPSAT